jgi:hypothetical protein
MAYTYNNRPTTFYRDPIDPNSTDWFYISFQNWLRPGESIVSHAASVEGGTMVTASTSLGSVLDSDSVAWTNTYGTKVSVTEGASKVKITWRVSTTVAGSPNLGRTAMDFTAIIPVAST